MNCPKLPCFTVIRSVDNPILNLIVVFFVESIDSFILIFTATGLSYDVSRTTERLNVGDALYTLALHTSGNWPFGMMDPIAKTDVYLNGGKKYSYQHF